MKKLVTILKKKRKLIIIAGVCFLGLLLFFLFYKSESYKEKQISYLEVTGKEFYEEVYYPKLENGDEEKRKEMLKEYQEVGFKISLKALSNYDLDGFQNVKKYFKSPDTNKDCNANDTIIYIYPKSPFGPEDYDIKVKIECGYDVE